MSEHPPVALVTGAARRLGLYLCERLVADGWQVIALTRQASPELIDLAGDNLEILRCGAYDGQSLEQALTQLRRMAPTLDLLVHNASMFEKDRAAADVASFYDQLYQVHMRMPVLLNEGLEAPLRRAPGGGCVVHITDIYVDRPNPEYALYCSTKAGLESLARSYARKWAPAIRVNTIQPGPIKFLPGHHDTDDKQSILSETPMASEGGFHPIYQGLRAIVENPYMTGASIKIDGGRALGQS